MEWLLISVYTLCVLFIFLFSLGQLHLTLVYLSNKGKSIPLPDMKAFPHVTVQLPIFNERYVAERLIDSICQLDYPLDKLEIQVLDDSTDKTVALVAKRVKHFRKRGIDIQQIQRKDRTGFKAGALAHGTAIAKGELTAVFDADFLPHPDFLLKTVPYFENEHIGCVQTRWGHVNKDYSLLTQLQAFGLDAHFTVEQTGRHVSRSFMNFNGTGGVWRKQCIADAGGWSADTLTEDLDLSYRAQLKGWSFHFAEGVVTPAELPVIMPAIKSQQYRWNKGAAETARKNLGRVLLSKRGLKTKIHAFFHLLNSSVFLSLIIAAVLSLPLLFVKLDNAIFNQLFGLGQIFLLGFFSITAFYFVATRAIGLANPTRYFFSKYPLFLTFSMGLSLHNAIAVAEGLVGRKTPFIRTPKFNIIKKGDSWRDNQYVKPSLSLTSVLEGLFCLYFAAGTVSGLLAGEYLLPIFHSMLTVGFGIIFFNSMKAYRYG